MTTNDITFSALGVPYPLVEVLAGQDRKSVV